MRTEFQRRQHCLPQYSPAVKPLQYDPHKYDFISFCHSSMNIHGICQLPTACTDQIATDNMEWGIHKTFKIQHYLERTTASSTLTFWYRPTFQSCLLSRFVTSGHSDIHTIFETPSVSHYYPMWRIKQPQRTIQSTKGELIFGVFLGASQNCEKRLLVSSCPSVSPSVRIEHVMSHWTDFHDILTPGGFFFCVNLFRKFKFD